MTANCTGAVRGKLMRTIALDVCGNPITGAASSLIVSSGFISIKPTPQYEDPTEYLQRNANDEFCVNERGNPQLKRVELEVVLCTLDPDLIVQVGGERLLSTATTGTGVFFGSDLVTSRFSLEVWQNATGVDACNAAGVQQYVYWAWPNLGNVKFGDFSIENGVLQFKFTCESKSWGSRWGVLPTVLPPNGYLDGTGFQATEHYAYNLTAVAPPTAACGAVTLA